MSESGEETKTPELPVDTEECRNQKEEEGSTRRHHRRHNRRHEQDYDHEGRNGRDRDNRTRRQRGGCYSSAPDEEKRAKLFAELVAEKDRLDPKRNPHLYRLISTEISRVAISPEAEHSQEVDLYNDYPITLNVRCFPPCKLQPNFNYAGRIIGPKGAYLKALMRETNAKITVLGQGVMKDKGKEAELLESGDPKYMHLTEDMHFSVTVDGPAIEAYDRMSNAIDCLKRQLLSDSRDLMSLPWIYKVVENGADPPKGVKVHFPRRSHGRDQGFRQRATSPYQQQRRRSDFRQGRSDMRRNFDSPDGIRRQFSRERRSRSAPRRARSYMQVELEGSSSPKIRREARRRRNAPASPASEGYRERSTSRSSTPHKKIRRIASPSAPRRPSPSRQRSVSPTYAAPMASSEDRRGKWVEVTDRKEPDSVLRYVPYRYRHYYF